MRNLTDKQKSQKAERLIAENKELRDQNKELRENRVPLDVPWRTFEYHGFTDDFQTDREIQRNDGLYRENPSISEKMHCVLFVVNADMLDKGREYSTLKNKNNIFQTEIFLCN